MKFIYKWENYFKMRNPLKNNRIKKIQKKNIRLDFNRKLINNSIEKIISKRMIPVWMKVNLDY